MNFKIGVGLLLFGILLANGAAFDIGSILFIVGGCIGAVGLAIIVCGNDNNNDKQK